ncbi:MAG: TM2 domain-containing protein [Oscillospiraceae bacterium]|nr:TM2 domain-containing protein [Oscillospiraceae bacterium]
MFCRNCGNEFTNPDAIICPRCETRTGEGNNNCQACGAYIDPSVEICPCCGVKLVTKGAKSKVAVGLAAIFLGSFGVHCFMLGYKKKGAIFLTAFLVNLIIGYGIATILLVITLGLSFVLPTLITLVFAVWGVVDAIMIFTGKVNKDAQGRFLK